MKGEVRNMDCLPGERIKRCGRLVLQEILTEVCEWMIRLFCGR